MFEDEITEYPANDQTPAITGAEQIIKLISWLQINKNQFAMSIGVPQAILSHILSGRNKPSLDVMKKIMQAYPQINPHWLLFGDGDMFTASAHTASKSEEAHFESQPSSVAAPIADMNNNNNAGNVVPKVQSNLKPVKTIILIFEDNTSQVINL